MHILTMDARHSPFSTTCVLAALAGLHRAHSRLGMSSSLGPLDKVGMTGWPNFFAFSAVVALSTWGFNEVVETVKRHSHHTVAPGGSRVEADQVGQPGPEYDRRFASQ